MHARRLGGRMPPSPTVSRRPKLMTVSTTEPSATGSWRDVLGRIEESLRQSLEQLALPSPPEDAPAAAPPRALDEWLSAWQARLEEVEMEAAEADGLLAAAGEALGKWQAEAAAVRERLAGWAQRGV